MKKHNYKAINVKNINLKELSEVVKEKRIVFGIDVAKYNFAGALMDENQKVIQIIKWKQPEEVKILVGFINALPVSKLEVAMESSGSYGDALRELLLGSGKEVYMVSSKRTHDAAEVYDGVDSMIDPKAAAIIAKLHLDGASEKWRIKTNEERELEALIDYIEIYKKALQANNNRLEAKLARYWPELNDLLSPGSVTLVNLLMRYGCPSEVAKDALNARVLMKEWSRDCLMDEKIARVIESASDTIGVTPLPAEIDFIKQLAGDINELNRKLKEMEKKVKKAVKGNKVIEALSKVIGIITAAALFVKLGDPKKYGSAKAYIKALGLNLKERSSGTHKGRLKITKRGSSRVRFYLYLAVLRMIKSDEKFSAWHNQKVTRDGGIKLKAIIGLMRKLAAGLWHVAQGKTFDSALLFDMKKLNILKMPESSSMITAKPHDPLNEIGGEVS